MSAAFHGSANWIYKTAFVKTFAELTGKIVHYFIPGTVFAVRIEF
jgi:hypothetical protein